MVFVHLGSKMQRLSLSGLHRSGVYRMCRHLSPLCKAARALPRPHSPHPQRSSYQNRLTSTDGKEKSNVSMDPVLVERNPQTGIALVILNRPEKLNAMTVELGEKFQEVMQGLRSDEELRCVVITGAGRAFSSGGDLDFLTQRTKDKPHKNSVEMLRFYKRFLSVRDIPVPVISAINGHAVGAGMCLAMATDIRFGFRDAKLGFNFVRLGLHPGLAATHFLGSNTQVANYMLMTGELITGERAEGMGLLLRAMESPEETVSEALKVADAIAQASPVAVRDVVTTLRARQDKELEAAIIREANAQAGSYASDDILEGLTALQEKRKPNF